MFQPTLMVLKWHQFYCDFTSSVRLFAMCTIYLIIHLEIRNLRVFILVLGLVEKGRLLNGINSRASRY